MALLISIHHGVPEQTATCNVGRFQVMWYVRRSSNAGCHGLRLHYFVEPAIPPVFSDLKRKHCAWHLACRSSSFAQDRQPH